MDKRCVMYIFLFFFYTSRTLKACILNINLLFFLSGNVVWLDNASAARAMLGLSKRIVGVNDKPEGNKSNANTLDGFTNEDCIIEVEQDSLSDKESEEKKYINEINIKDIDYPLPPGIWRKGVNYNKSKGIFLRFATRSDKKQPNAEKMSDYYKKYGNPNFGGNFVYILCMCIT